MTTRRRRRATTREEVVNTLLAQELRRHGLSAREERRTLEGVPDVRIELRGGELVLLECKWESAAAQLDEQLEGRLEQFPDAVAVVGVTYPDSLRDTDDTQAALESADNLRWRIHGSRGGGTPGSPERAGAVEELAHQLRTLPLELEDLSVFDPRALSPEQLQALSGLFDEMAEAKFLRLPDMRECPARRALDDGLSRILNLPDLVSVRHLLATKPVVSNRRL